MSEWTYATVSVSDEDVSAARADFEYYFNCKCKDINDAIFWVTSGPFGNEELDAICNEVAWPKRVIFGADADAALVKLGLVKMEESV